MSFSDDINREDSPTAAKHLLWPVIPNTNMKLYARNFGTRSSARLPYFNEKVSNGDYTDSLYTSFFSPLPWEKQKYFADFYVKLQRQLVRHSYTVEQSPRRKLLDTFADSLLHVSRIYNKAFGYQVRKVPAHMPHMVDRDVISHMQKMFWKHFDATSSHQVRHPQDMQFAFSYNYFIVGAPGLLNRSDLFDTIDADYSGTLSDRELRTLAATILPLPLNLESIKYVESTLKNCSKSLHSSDRTNLPTGSEDYFDKNMPLVTKTLFLACEQLFEGVNQSLTKPRKYKHELVGEDDIAFKMIRNNVSYVLHQLDWIRKHRRKFVCLNDNLDHAREDTKTIRALLRDFYESFFPLPSQFELPKNYRNRFLYKKDLNIWMLQNQQNGNTTTLVIVLILCLIFMFIFRRKILYCFRYFAGALPIRSRNRVSTPSYSI